MWVTLAAVDVRKYQQYNIFHSKTVLFMFTDTARSLKSRDIVKYKQQAEGIKQYTSTREYYKYEPC